MDTPISQKVPRLPAYSREQVHHVHLVFEDHQGNDVAVRRKIGIGIESSGKGCQIQILVRHDGFGLGSISNDSVAHVSHPAGLTSNVPAAPTFFQWAAMIGNVVAEPWHCCSIGRGELTPHQHAGNAHRVVRVMAGQALVVTCKLWLLDRHLRQCVKNDALTRVLYCYLDKAATHPSNRREVVEEKRAWVVWVYAFSL